MKNGIKNELKDRPEAAAGLRVATKIDDLFKAVLYLLYLATLTMGAVWVAGFVTENFSMVLIAAYSVDGQRGLVLIALVFGFLAYLIKLYQRLWYGICEALIGMYVIHYGSPAQIATSNGPDTIKIAGGLFVIVRGLDNGYGALQTQSWNRDRIREFGRWS